MLVGAELVEEHTWVVTLQSNPFGCPSQHSETSHGPPESFASLSTFGLRGFDVKAVFIDGNEVDLGNSLLFEVIFGSDKCLVEFWAF